MAEFLSESSIVKQSNDYKVLSKQTFPTTIILLITTHGEVRLDEKGEVQKFTIPKDMTIIRSMSSVIGECNIVSEPMVNDYIKSVNNNFKYLLDTTNLPKQILGVNLVTKDIRSIDTEHLPTNILQEIKIGEKVGEKKDLDIYKTYNYGFDRAHTIKVVTGNQEIMNKIYTRTSDEQPTEYDWVIKPLNLEGEPELLNFFTSYLNRAKRGKVNEIITLENIVEFLYSKGVKTIIIFDISCTTIRDQEGYDISEREVRNKRRKLQNMRELKLGGNRKKKSKITNKKKKTKIYKRKKKTRKNYFPN
jgi:hypothetical protein